ncbi:MAG: GntR family transcriptional regulator [Desulfobacterales bacterium]|nr:MAG: GntR family transcriptional regulator [Desulfobacterales bacterium]
MASEELTGKIKDLDFRPHVLGQQVSHILAEAILEGVLKGGDQLTEVELQKQFGISRSPLREAFRDLEKKGLVVIIPRRGTFVKRITRKDIEENFPVRSVLEGLAAKEAHPKMTSQILEELAQVLNKMETAVEKNDTKAYWKNHLEFHDIFIKATGNEVLISILKTLRMHSLWYRFSYQYYQEDLHRSLAVHQKIFGLLRNKDADIDEIGNLVQEHIQTAYQSFIDYLNEQTI